MKVDEAVEAAATSLRERARSRLLAWERVEAAAYLGDLAAIVCCQRCEPPRSIPAPPRSTAPGLLARLFGAAPDPEPLAGWALGVECIVGLELATRAAAATLETLLPGWERAYPNRPEPRRALEAVRAWCDAQGSEARATARDAARASASVLHSLAIVGPTPCDELSLLTVELAILDGQLDLAEVARRTARALAVSNAVAAERRAIAAAKAARRSFDDLRAEAERARRPDERAAAEAVKDAIVAALAPDLLDPARPDLRAPQSLDVVRERHAERSRRLAVARARADEIMRANAPAEPQPSADSQALLLAVGLLGVPGVRLASMAMVDWHATGGQARRPGQQAIESPEARWGCPRCAALNPNTAFLCLACGYKVA